MELVVDSLDSVSGWTSSDEAKVSISSNEWPSKIYRGAHSAQIKVSETASGVTVTKQYGASVDCSAYVDLRMAIQRTLATALNKYVEDEDFALKVSIGDTVDSVYTPAEEWYVPVNGLKRYEILNFDISAISSFDTIQFTVLSDEAETYFVDNIIVCKDDPVVDVFAALIEELNLKRTYFLENNQAPITAGDAEVAIANFGFADRWSLLRFVEGAKEEYHQIDSLDVETGKVTFTPDFAGESFKQDFSTSAEIYMVLPCGIASKYLKYTEPGLVLSGSMHNYVSEDGGYIEKDSYKTSGEVRVMRREREGEVLVDLSVVTPIPELMIELNGYIQGIFGDYSLYSNGYYFDLTYEGNEFEEGNIEGVSDRTIHKLHVQLVSNFGVVPVYVNFPLTAIITFNMTA